MADQGKWFKLYVGWDDDPHISALTTEDQLRWCKFGTYVKEHGTNGSIVLVSPAKPLQNRFGVSGFKAVISCIKRLPGYGVNEEGTITRNGVTSVTVTCKNWQQYQGDFSRERMRRFRSRVTVKRRREVDVEEKRREVPLPTDFLSGTSTPTANGEHLTPREKGTNPRAQGTNPRALGTNPRAIEAKSAKKVLEGPYG